MRLITAAEAANITAGTTNEAVAKWLSDISGLISGRADAGFDYAYFGGAFYDMAFERRRSVLKALTVAGYAVTEEAGTVRISWRQS